MKHPWSPQQFAEGAKAAGRADTMIASAENAAAAIKRVHPDLPVILTLHHLAHLSGVSAQDLQQVAFRKEDPYRIFRVKKRGVAGAKSRPAAAVPDHLRAASIPDANAALDRPERP